MFHILLKEDAALGRILEPGRRYRYDTSVFLLLVTKGPIGHPRHFGLGSTRKLWSGLISGDFNARVMSTLVAIK